MNQSPLITKQNISIALVWLFHLSGLIGIIYSNAYWFIKATPLNLLLSFILLLINCEWTKKTVFIVVLCFTIGMLAEIVGVEYGFIFGEYSYGNALGTKFLGVPLIIGLNWCILVLMTGFISQFFLILFCPELFWVFF